MVQEREKAQVFPLRFAAVGMTILVSPRLLGDGYQLGNNAVACLGVGGDFFGNAGFVSGEHDA